MGTGIDDLVIMISMCDTQKILLSVIIRPRCHVEQQSVHMKQKNTNTSTMGKR